MSEEGIEVVKVPTDVPDDVADRLANAVDERTAAVLVSAVMFRNAHIVHGLGRAGEACERAGAHLLVDAYHALNVVPFSLPAEGLEQAFVVGGGYKYCQLGEGNCFLRVPPGCELRPVVTGWFAEFGSLIGATEGWAVGNVPYAAGPERFAGSTYDPTSHYRASAVFDFFDQLELTPGLLRRVSQHQVATLAESFDALDADPALITRDRTTPLQGLGGFLALRSEFAGELHASLRTRGVRTDYREDLLRFGPAPYLSDAQLEDAMGALGDALASLSGGEP